MYSPSDRIIQIRSELFHLDDEISIYEADRRDHYYDGAQQATPARPTANWHDAEYDNYCVRRCDLQDELQELLGVGYAWEPPTLKACKKSLGSPATWVSQCYAVACQLQAKLHIPGTVEYGFYNGHVVMQSVFYKRSLVRHGWIRLTDGRILDPTRWVFDTPDQPYMWCCKDIWREYDFGMNRWKEQNLSVAPMPGQYAADSPQEQLIKLRLPVKTKKFVNGLLQKVRDRPFTLTWAQVFWLANYPLHLFDGHALAIYTAIQSAGLIAMVPIDNREAMLCTRQTGTT